MLTQYAESLDRQDEKERLLKEIEKIEYIEGTTVCIGIEANRAFHRAQIDYLLTDLEHRTLEFFAPEDIGALAQIHRSANEKKQVIE